MALPPMERNHWTVLSLQQFVDGDDYRKSTNSMSQSSVINRMTRQWSKEIPFLHPWLLIAFAFNGHVSGLAFAMFCVRSLNLISYLSCWLVLVLTFNTVASVMNLSEPIVSNILNHLPCLQLPKLILVCIKKF